MTGEWDEERHLALFKEVEQQVRATQKQAEALGTLQNGPHAPIDSMFEDVYKDMPWYLQRQRDELKGS